MEPTKASTSMHPMSTVQAHTDIQYSKQSLKNTNQFSNSLFFFLFTFLLVDHGTKRLWGNRRQVWEDDPLVAGTG